MVYMRNVERHADSEEMDGQEVHLVEELVRKLSSVPGVGKSKSGGFFSRRNRSEVSMQLRLGAEIDGEDLNSQNSIEESRDESVSDEGVQKCVMNTKEDEVEEREQSVELQLLPSERDKSPSKRLTQRTIRRMRSSSSKMKDEVSPTVKILTGEDGEMPRNAVEQDLQLSQQEQSLSSQASNSLKQSRLSDIQDETLSLKQEEEELVNQDASIQSPEHSGHSSTKTQTKNITADVQSNSTRLSPIDEIDESPGQEAVLLESKERSSLKRRILNPFVHGYRMKARVRSIPVVPPLVGTLDDDETVCSTSVDAEPVLDLVTVTSGSPDINEIVPTGPTTSLGRTEELEEPQPILDLVTVTSGCRDNNEVDLTSPDTTGGSSDEKITRSYPSPTDVSNVPENLLQRPTKNKRNRKKKKAEKKLARSTKSPEVKGVNDAILLKRNKGGNIIVSKVPQESRHMGPSLKVGDEIISIGNIKCKGMTVAEVGKMIGHANGSLRISARRRHNPNDRIQRDRVSSGEKQEGGYLGLPGVSSTIGSDTSGTFDEFARDGTFDEVAREDTFDEFVRERASSINPNESFTAGADIFLSFRRDRSIFDVALEEDDSSLASAPGSADDASAQEKIDMALEDLCLLDCCLDEQCFEYEPIAQKCCNRH